MMKRIFVFLCVVPVWLMVSGCSVNPATGKQSFTAFMSPEKEIRVGREEHPKIINQFGGEYEDEDLASYVRDVGLALAKTSEKPDLTWHFTVLNDTQVNAFALPGGYVYVTRGLLALVSDEAELAGVLSHEIAHVTARHSAQRYSSTMAANIGVQVLGVLSQAAGLGGAGGQIASIGANLALKGYSREQELESDMLGVRYMNQLGYDPQSVVQFFEKLRTHQAIEDKRAGRGENASDQHNIFATHPRTADRIQQAIDLASQVGGSSDVRRADRYLDQIDGLTFGDDPEQGLVRGRVFTHPTLNFRFEVPEGFTLKNTPEMVLATDKSGSVIKFAGASAKDVRAAGGLERYLVRKWSQNLNLKNIDHLTINGMAAVTGVATVWAGNKQVDVRRILIRKNSDTYWQLQFVTGVKETARLNEPLRHTTYSFRELTDEEFKAAKPWTVRVVQAGSGVSVKNLIDSMAVSTEKASWFKALNGLSVGDALSPNRRLKVIQ